VCACARASLIAARQNVKRIRKEWLRMAKDGVGRDGENGKMAFSMRQLNILRFLPPLRPFYRSISCRISPPAATFSEAGKNIRRDVLLHAEAIHPLIKYGEWENPRPRRSADSRGRIPNGGSAVVKGCNQSGAEGRRFFHFRPGLGGARRR
jgi:hypothetical protein